MFGVDDIASILQEWLNIVEVIERAWDNGCVATVPDNAVNSTLIEQTSMLHNDSAREDTAHTITNDMEKIRWERSAFSLHGGGRRRLLIWYVHLTASFYLDNSMIKRVVPILMEKRLQWLICLRLSVALHNAHLRPVKVVEIFTISIYVYANDSLLSQDSSGLLQQCNRCYNVLIFFFSHFWRNKKACQAVKGGGSQGHFLRETFEDEQYIRDLKASKATIASRLDTIQTTIRLSLLDFASVHISSQYWRHRNLRGL